MSGLNPFGTSPVSFLFQGFFSASDPTAVNELVTRAIYNGVVTRTAVIPVEQFTGQINTRVRGRQMSFKIDSDALGVTWQLGAPRMDIRPDGRRGG